MAPVEAAGWMWMGDEPLTSEVMSVSDGASCTTRNQVGCMTRNQVGCDRARPRGSEGSEEGERGASCLRRAGGGQEGHPPLP
jgi:hypothetical protein